MGAHDGTWNSPPTLTNSLPSGSDEAVLLNGSVNGTIVHSSDFSLATFSVSLWLELTAFPVNKVAIFSKDGSGLVNGDFSITVDPNGELLAQFQAGPPTSLEYKIPYIVDIGVVYHVVVTASGSGFTLWVNGRHIQTDIGWTGGWTGNTRQIQIGTAEWASESVQGKIDEVAVYSKVLSDSEIIGLSTVTSLPVLGNGSFELTVGGNGILALEFMNPQFVGKKANLAFNFSAVSSGITPTKTGSGDISIVSSTGTGNKSFNVTIQDNNGVSNTATVSVLVNPSGSTGSGDGFGGTLVYEWAPLASWMTGALSTRNATVVRQLSRWTNTSAATVGASLPISISSTGGDANYCFNFAPPAAAGSKSGQNIPSIELWVEPGRHYPMGIAVQLWPKMSTNPRHIRLVIEVKTSKAGDSTANKGAGIGTAGSYTDFKNTHLSNGPGGTNVSMKYMLGTSGGQAVLGGGSANWWNNATFPCDRAYFSTVTGSASPGYLRHYLYTFGRPAANQYGFGSGAGDVVGVDSTGVHGVWHRLEMEFRLTTPGNVQENTWRRGNLSGGVTVPQGTGDGFSKMYLTKDIDGELGTPGTRQFITQVPEQIFFCKHDDTGGGLNNMHILANFWCVFLYLYYGGSAVAQADGWAWIRKVEAYRYTADDI